MSETRGSWWTNCPECERGFTITSVPGINEGTPDPERADYVMNCPFDGEQLTAWNWSPPRWGRVS